MCFNIFGRMAGSLDPGQTALTCADPEIFVRGVQVSLTKKSSE